MKTLILFASPNAKGNTSKLVDKLIEGLEGTYSIIDVYKEQINPCIDCGYCKKNIGKCSIEDSMSKVYKEIEQCTSIVIAAPMYFGMFPAPLKALIDRTQMNWSKKYIFNKTEQHKKVGGMIITAGAQWNDMFFCIEKIGRYFFNTLDCELRHKLFISNTDKVRVHKDLQVLENAYEIGRNIGKITEN